MRVLFITQRLPARSARGDQCRAFAHIRALSPRHRITSLSFSSAGAAERAALQPYCEDVIVLPRSRLRAAVRVLAALRGIQPLQVALHADAGRELDLAALRGRGFELVHVQLARLAPVLDEFAPLPRVLDFVDALSLNMARRARYDFCGTPVCVRSLRQRDRPHENRRWRHDGPGKVVPTRPGASGAAGFPPARAHLASRRGRCHACNRHRL